MPNETQPVYSKVRAVAVSGATVATVVTTLAIIGIEIPVDPQLVADNINLAIASIAGLITVVNFAAGFFKRETRATPTINVVASDDLLPPIPESSE